MLLLFIEFFHEWWLLKEPFASSHVYRRTLLSKSSFKWLIFTLLEQLNTNLQGGISIPPHSCLQWRLQPVTSTHIFPPRAIKYHKVREYLRGKWPTISLVFYHFHGKFVGISTKLLICLKFFRLLWVSKQLCITGQLNRKYAQPLSQTPPHI